MIQWTTLLLATTFLLGYSGKKISLLSVEGLNKHGQIVDTIDNYVIIAIDNKNQSVCGYFFLINKETKDTLINEPSIQYVETYHGSWLHEEDNFKNRIIPCDTLFFGSRAIDSIDESFDNKDIINEAGFNVLYNSNAKVSQIGYYFKRSNTISLYYGIAYRYNFTGHLIRREIYISGKQCGYAPMPKSK